MFKINFQNNVHPLKKIKPSFIYIFWSIIDWIIDWRLYTCNWWKYSDNDYVLLSTLKLTGVPYYLKDYLGFPLRKISIICWTKLTWSEIKLSDCPDLFMSDLKLQHVSSTDKCSTSRRYEFCYLVVVSSNIEIVNH